LDPLVVRTKEPVLSFFFPPAVSLAEMLAGDALGAAALGAAVLLLGAAALDAAALDPAALDAVGISSEAVPLSPAAKRVLPMLH
jgi:hypothetical protein